MMLGLSGSSSLIMWNWLPLGASGRRQPVEGTTAGDDPGMGALVPCGECTH